MLRLRMLLCVALFAAAPSLAPAATYLFVPEQTSYELTVGQTVPVKIYFQETLGPAEPSVIDADDGVYALGLRAELQPSAASSPTTIVSESDVQVYTANFSNTFPDAPVIDLVDGSVNLTAFSADAPGPKPVGDPRRIEVATITFTAGSDDNGGVTVYRLQDIDPESEDSRTWEDTQIDPTGFSTITFTVIPEPNTCLVFLGLSAAMLRRSRQRVSC